MAVAPAVYWLARFSHVHVVCYAFAYYYGAIIHGPRFAFTRICLSGRVMKILEFHSEEGNILWPEQLLLSAI